MRFCRTHQLLCDHVRLAPRAPVRVGDVKSSMRACRHLARRSTGRPYGRRGVLRDRSRERRASLHPGIYPPGDSSVGTRQRRPPQNSHLRIYLCFRAGRSLRVIAARRPSGRQVDRTGTGTGAALGTLSVQVEPTRLLRVSGPSRIVSSGAAIRPPRGLASGVQDGIHRWLTGGLPMDSSGTSAPLKPQPRRIRRSPLRARIGTATQRGIRVS